MMRARSWWLIVVGAVACGPAVRMPVQAEDGSGSTSAAAGDGSSEGVAAGPCDDAEVLVQPGPGGQPSGLERCADGFIHRARAVDCDPGAWVAGDCTNTWDAPGECTSDDACPADGDVRGLCLDSGVPWEGCSCSTGCRSDADCAADEACICDGARSECVPAGCRTDADCGAGGLCGLNQLVGGCGTISRALSCTTSADECRVDGECDECLQCLRWVESPSWSCTGSTGICGPCG